MIGLRSVAAASCLELGRLGATAIYAMLESGRQADTGCRISRNAASSRVKKFSCDLCELMKRPKGERAQGPRKAVGAANRGKAKTPVAAVLARTGVGFPCLPYVALALGMR